MGGPAFPDSRLPVTTVRSRDIFTREGAVCAPDCRVPTASLASGDPRSYLDCGLRTGGGTCSPVEGMRAKYF